MRRLILVAACAAALVPLTFAGAQQPDGAACGTPPAPIAAPPEGQTVTVDDGGVIISGTCRAVSATVSTSLVSTPADVDHAGIQPQDVLGPGNNECVWSESLLLDGLTIGSITVSEPFVIEPYSNLDGFTEHPDISTNLTAEGEFEGWFQNGAPQSFAWASASFSPGVTSAISVATDWHLTLKPFPQYTVPTSNWDQHLNAIIQSPGLFPGLTQGVDYNVCEGTWSGDITGVGKIGGQIGAILCWIFCNPTDNPLVPM